MAPLGFRMRARNPRTTIEDNFNRTLTGSLGSTSTGGKPWEILSGTWNVDGAKAVSTTTRSSNPIAVVTAGYANIDSQITVGPGDALYFRVQDTNNWWRIVHEGWQTSSCSTCYDTCYDTCYQQCCQSCCSTCCSSCVNSYAGCHYSADGSFGGCQGCGSCSCGCPGGMYCGSMAGQCEYSCNCVSCNCVSCNCTSCNPYSCNPYSCNPYTCNCNYYNNYQVKLQKMLGGSLSTITSQGTSGGTSVVRVVATGTNIKAYRDTSTLFYDAAQADLQTAIKHGIGRGASDYDTPTLDNYSLKLAV